MPTVRVRGQISAETKLWFIKRFQANKSTVDKPTARIRLKAKSVSIGMILI